MVEAIVLAGGAGRRAGGNKMLFTLHEKPLIKHTVASLMEHVEHVVVVTGNYHNAIDACFNADPKVTVIHNPAHAKGMFTSVKTGMKHTNGHVLILPGDMPLVKPQTVAALLNGSGRIRLPVYNGRKGHPLYLDQSLRTPLLEANDNANLKTFRDQYTFEGIDVDDSGVLVDVDTKERLDALNKRKELDNEN